MGGQIGEVTPRVDLKGGTTGVVLPSTMSMALRPTPMAIAIGGGGGENVGQQSTSAKEWGGGLKAGSIPNTTPHQLRARV